jgi:hypothetical protein
MQRTGKSDLLSESAITEAVDSVSVPLKFSYTIPINESMNDSELVI